MIVDLAAERGGNVELTQPGQVVTTANGVTIIGYTNVPARLATSASQLYARNLYAFIETLFDKKTKEFAVNWDDELVKATLLTRNGTVVHPNSSWQARQAAGRAPRPMPRKQAAPTASAPAATMPARRRHRSSMTGVSARSADARKSLRLAARPPLR